MSFVERYRELGLAAADRDVVLGVIRREGAGFTDCVKVLHDVVGFTLVRAKAAVHSSPASEDDRSVRQAFWEEVIAIVQVENGT